MFLNSIYTDGYTCRVSFCRKAHSISPNDKVSLKVDDFTSEEVDRYFRPCTVDPNRSDVFVSYHGKNNLRRLSTAEYYNMNGTVNRQKLEQDRKKRSDIVQIETHFPSPKTANLQHYTEYVMYALQHFRALANSYGLNTAKIKWCNYKGSQQAIENAVNILINGAKKYNKSKRKNTKKNKWKRRKTSSSYQYGHHDNYSPNTGGMRSRAHKEKFEEGDQSKIPLIVFGDGLKNKSHVKFKGLRYGVIEKLYRQLRIREKRGELLLLDIDEYKTSKICNSCLENKLEHITQGSGIEKTEDSSSITLQKLQYFLESRRYGFEEYVHNRLIYLERPRTPYHVQPTKRHLEL